MPITLDPSLPRPLYPLAWLIGSWEGSGALQSTEDGAPGRRVEQQLDCTAQEDGTLSWVSRIHVIDAPAPLPPTSAFSRDDAPAPAPSGTGERSLLHREEGVWRVGDLLPGQDVAAAESARPGTPASALSSALEVHLERRGEEPEDWVGEVRGPRVQLALTAPGAAAEGTSVVTAARMFGYVSGRLMWLWERRTPVPDGAPGETALTPYLSLELHRV
ncbi:heme-binding beta-barrel domain-containing protein [Brachybacterium sp. YJGR34]|uniref:heme-binding beta-barrel domain-containing protein n=1 Tax=Brachybacterium sp. YJGR34 TaxID=2059911 RepID=UPI000E0C9D20|nr:heme-binding beta-barrel domain-containing protein [Brachybacterium sp. YJGR34]